MAQKERVSQGLKEVFSLEKRDFKTQIFAYYFGPLKNYPHC